MNAVHAQRELTTDERIAQIGWEIARERAEGLAHLADAKAHGYDLEAGDPNAFRHIALCEKWAADCNRRVEDLLYELNNLRPVLRVVDEE